MVSSKILKIHIFLIIYSGFLFDGGATERDGNSASFLNATFSPDCHRDLKRILNGLQWGETWALKILDSMEKFPSGLLLGRRTAFGHFEECLKVVHPNFTTKHCVVELKLKTAANTSRDLTQATAAELRLSQFGYGVCIPSTCSSTDLVSAVKALKLNDIITAKANDTACTTELFPELRTKDYVAIALFVLLIILAGASTAYDVYTSGRKTGQSEILKSFSIQSNMRSLFEINGQSREMDCLNGIRFLSFLWLILGHLYSGTVGSVNIVNPLDMVKTLTKKSNIFGSNSFLCVDTYFFLSGLLVCFIFFRRISGKGTFDFPVNLIHRYLRLTPSLVAIMIFNFTFLSRLCTGPYTKVVHQEVEENCENYWWGYILYIQNPLYKGQSQCFAADWYLCADMQMFVLSPLILYVLLLWPKFGPAYLGSLILASTGVSFIVSYADNVAPNPTFQYVWAKLRAQKYEYILFATRMTPWLVGVATAYIIVGIKAKKITFQPKRHWVIIGWLTAALLYSSSLYGIAAFFPLLQDPRHSKIEYSAYRALHRLGWSLGLSWTVIACVNNCGGVINTFLSYPVFNPLGKLTYCGYLNHLTVQTFRLINNMTTETYFSRLEMLYNFVGDSVLSLTAAVPMTLLVEMPFSNIERILLKDLVIFPYPNSKKCEKINDAFAKNIDKEKGEVIRYEKNDYDKSAIKDKPLGR